VHAREAEEKFIAEGFGVRRYSVMYNDFIIIGPKDDPASIKGARNVAFALQAIKAKDAPFISRGDRSGTHIAELNLWKAAGIDIKKEAGPWYKSRLNSSLSPSTAMTRSSLFLNEIHVPRSDIT